MTAVKLTRSCLLGMMLVIGVSGCVYDPYYSAPPTTQRYYPYYYPYYYDYYYYPGVRVYFQISTGYYFYYLQNRWIRTRTLPPHIHISPWDRVKLRINSEKPYLRNNEHVKKYHPQPRPPEYRDRTPDYRERPPVPKPAPPSVWDRAKQPSVSRPAPTRDRRPETAPFEKREAPVYREEREHNRQIYQEDQKKQKEYEKDWEKRNKVYRR